MPTRIDYHTFLWLAPSVVIALVLGRVLWVYRGSSNWPIVDGTITRLDVQRRRDTSGPYICATFTYVFRDLDDHEKSGTWYKNFSTEEDAQDFAERELQVGKQVQVRFDPKDPGVNYLELDASTYTNDRPTSLNL